MCLSPEVTCSWLAAIVLDWQNFEIYRVRFEVFTAVTTKNAVLWDVTPSISGKNRCFGGIHRLQHRCDKNRRARKQRY
jgi:hypothetical protein